MEMILGPWRECGEGSDCWHRDCAGSSKIILVAASGYLDFWFMGELDNGKLNLPAHIGSVDGLTLEETKIKIDATVDRFLKLQSFI